MRNEAFSESGPGDEKSIAFSIYQPLDGADLLRMWRTIADLISWSIRLRHASIIEY